MYYFIRLNNQRVDECVFDIEYEEDDFETRYIIWDEEVIYPEKMNFWNCIESIEVFEDIKEIEGQLEFI
ncbi:hypothetical protein [Anaerococcus hydrogenalis]|jgi:hypothetical protein|uniref:hypothetical protein n=1 Tax=Anaerococcus hydrogenalis TaxID=33029 RepID=UPI002904E215|nr:hypothetical protein [Anaerococcus hydrogenalis]MDU1315690.1 hypothetical protein [Anaerococcus hydrogenalis]